MRVIVGISGASGAPLAVGVLQALKQFPDVETHLVVSKWARSTIQLETGFTPGELASLATENHAPGNQGAPISSGSFHADAMIIVPCSMKTVAGIRTGYAEDLLLRAADVTIKENRPLVLVPRETPLSSIHLDNLLALSRMGVRIVPPTPAFYNNPETLDDVINHIVQRVLDQIGLDAKTAPRWEGLQTIKHELATR